MLPKRGELRPTPLEYSRSAQRYVQPGTELPRAMLFHDSYASLVRPMLAMSFSRLSCFWKYQHDLALIEEEQPDCVIDLMVERVFVMVDPVPHMLDTQARLRADFESTGEVLLELDPLEDEGVQSQADDHVQQRGNRIRPGGDLKSA